VAGRSLTLALPEGAKAGDTLELVMVDRTPQAIVARLANGAGAAAGAATATPASLSSTGQLIAALLANEGEAAPQLTLTANRPLLASVPASANNLAAELPSALAQAVATSGLFYESHQVQWVLGQRPLASLLVEPQGRYASAATAAESSNAAAPVAANGAEKSALAGRLATDGNGVSALSLLRTLFGAAAPNAATANTTAANAANDATASNQAAQTAPAAAHANGNIPDDLRPLVQQQLDAAASQRLAWHGEVWPQQTMDWAIAHDEPSTATAAESSDVWRTTVHLVLPRLGELSAQLAVNGPRLSLTVQAADAAGAAALQAQAPQLQAALSAAGLTLQQFDVRHGD
jgi:hypothetical protein